MKKQLLKIFNVKKLTFVLLAFIGLSSFQLNAQTELTVSDVVEVQSFTLGTGGDLTASDAAVFEGTGTLVNQTGYLRIISNGTFADHKSRLTFDLKSTAGDVTSTLTFKFRKRIGNTVSGFVTVGGTTTNVTLAGTNGTSFTQTGVTVSNSFEDVEVVLDDITLTPTAQTIIFTFTLIDQNLGTNNPQIRFDEISINKTAVVGGCTIADDVTTLAASAGAEHISLSWVDPTCFDEVLVVAKEGSTVTVTPTGDGSAYSADAAFASGTDLGTAEYAVYKGTANTATITGLTKGGTTYHFEVFTRKGTDWSDGAVVNATTNNTYTSISGNTGVNWEDGSSWVGGVAPSAATDDAIIDGRLIINSNVAVNDIVITNRLTIEAGFSLDAQELTLNTGKLLIMKATSQTFASLIVNTLGAGSSTTGFIYDRFIANNPTNDLVSSPVSGMTMDGFYKNSQNENRLYIDHATDHFGQRYFVGPFNNASGLFEFLTAESSDGAGDNDNDVEFVSGKGFRMATNASETGVIRFAGGLKIDAGDIDITDGGAGTFAQWNLIGNPYASYLDFDSFLAANTAKFETGLNNGVYGWNGSTYTPLNLTTAAAAGAGVTKIAPSQGFFVKTKEATTGNVTFSPAMRRTGTGDDFILGKSANSIEVALAKINLSSATNTFTTDIYFVENQTRGLDSGYDAGAFDVSADGIYTNLVEDNTGVAISIQALPYDDYNNVVVPVAIKSEAGIELTISLDEVSLTLPSNINVYLKDNLLNTTTLLNEDGYVFTPTTDLSETGRFFIEFSSKAVLSTDEFALNELLIYSNQTSKSIIVKGILKADAIAKVYDIQGRVVLEQELDSSNITNVVNANALNTGVYIVQLEGKTQKVIIK